MPELQPSSLPPSHLGLGVLASFTLPHHDAWEGFFSSAQVVGLVGQHVGQVRQAPAVDRLSLPDPVPPDENVTTLWEYDVLGRVVTATVGTDSPQACSNWTCYGLQQDHGREGAGGVQPAHRELPLPERPERDAVLE